MSLFELWDFGDPAASELRFRAATDAAEGEDRALALTQLARTYSLRGWYDEAREILSEAEGLLGDGDSLARGYYWIELGRTENSGGNPVGALPHFETSLEIAKRLNAQTLIGDAAHMVAIASPPELQPSAGQAALTIVRGLTDEKGRSWVGPILNNLGWALIDLNRPSEALPYLQQALDFRLSQGEKPRIRIAKYSVGYALRQLGRIDEAMAIQQEALAMGGSGGFIEEEIGECLCALGRVEEARPYFRAAYDKSIAQGDDPTWRADLLART
jgi:tetratricopeptide (TPR) repeat protein